MSLLKCPKCGEMFSDSYKDCPFCLEDEEFYNGKKPKNPGRRVERHKSPSIIGPAMVVVVLLLVGVLAYTFLGDSIGAIFSGAEDKPNVEDPVDSSQNNEDPDGQGGSDVTPVVIALDQTDLALTAGESALLTASGAEGIQWRSSDDSIATVDENGNVTAVNAGSATITASASGAASAACVVTVKASAKDLTLQSIYGTQNDISISVGQQAPMEVVGTDAAVTWSTEDSGVATVDADGVVTGVGRGTTNVIAVVEGQTLKCIIRVG